MRKIDIFRSLNPCPSGRYLERFKVPYQKWKERRLIAFLMNKILLLKPLGFRADRKAQAFYGDDPFYFLEKIFQKLILTDKSLGVLAEAENRLAVIISLSEERFVHKFLDFLQGRLKSQRSQKNADRRERHLVNDK